MTDVNFDKDILEEVKLDQLEQSVVDSIKKLPEERQLRLIEKALGDEKLGLYAEHRMVQIINHNGLPGICGNEDWCNTIGDTKIIVEYKYDNNKNSRESFIESGQFERDYKYKVDENFSRKVIVVFALHKCNLFHIPNDQLIIHGVYMKDDLNAKAGEWHFEYDGKTLKEFCNYIKTGFFYDALNINDMQFLYGEMQNSLDLGIRSKKVFWERIKKNGEIYYYSKAKDEAKLLSPKDLEKQGDNITFMNLKELYFDCNRLCFNTIHVKKNCKKQFYLCVRYNGLIHILRYNKDCTFLPKDFETFDKFLEKILNVLNVQFADKIKKRFVYYG